MSDLPDVLDRVKALKSHPDFIISNPNRARSLLSSFCNNLVHFHASDGKGYEFMADCILEIDAINPQVAARMASCFSQWKKFGPLNQELMKSQLERIMGKEGLSKDTYEVVSRCLA
jgi:aminopeptidase N